MNRNNDVNTLVSASTDRQKRLAPYIMRNASRQAGDLISFSTANEYIKNYNDFLKNKYIVLDSSGASTGDTVTFRELFHSDVCPKCEVDTLFPSYTISRKPPIKSALEKSVSFWNNAERLKMYPAIKKDKYGNNIFTMILMGANDDEVPYLKKRNSSDKTENFIYDFIDPCNPRCPQIE